MNAPTDVRHEHDTVRGHQVCDRLARDGEARVNFASLVGDLSHDRTRARGRPNQESAICVSDMSEEIHVSRVDRGDAQVAHAACDADNGHERVGDRMLAGNPARPRVTEPKSLPDGGGGGPVETRKLLADEATGAPVSTSAGQNARQFRRRFRCAEAARKRRRWPAWSSRARYDKSFAVFACESLHDNHSGQAIGCIG
jgi:hypothetical protein